MLLGLLIASSLTSYSQYFSKVYDYDSSLDWGWNVRVLSDSNILIVGEEKNVTTSQQEGLMYMIIKQDGSQVLNRHTIDYDSHVSFYEGSPSTMKNLPDSGYLIPMCKQFSHDTVTRSMAGLVRLNAQLDTVFVRTYTDTNVNFDDIYDCAIMPDGTYWIAGERSGAIYSPSNDSALIMHIDNAGNLLWAKTYKTTFYGIDYQFSSLQTLPNGNVLASASIVNPKVATVGLISQNYTLNSPWFIIMDTVGNILKDTVYTTHYGGCPAIVDKNGGYFIWGYLDSLITNNPLDEQNFPDFVAHLDTNFRMTWIRNFADNNAHYNINVIRQLHDKDYLIVGDNNGYWGWAAKINSITNTIIWDHNYYYIDSTTGFDYLVDGLELPNGNIIMTGSTMNPNEPNAYKQDVWIIEVDSNGCEVPGCGPGIDTTTNVGNVVNVVNVIIYPNPTSGNFTVSAPAAGTLVISNMTGQEISRYDVNSGKTRLHLPAELMPGVYTIKYENGTDKSVSVIRMIYNP